MSSKSLVPYMSSERSLRSHKKRSNQKNSEISKSPLQIGLSIRDNSFKHSLIKWIKYDEYIIKDKEKLQKIKESKKKLSSSIAKYLEDSKEENKEIRIKNRNISLKYQRKIQKTPINKKYILATLENYFSSKHKANEVVDILFNARKRMHVCIIAALGIEPDEAHEIVDYIYNSRKDEVSIGIKKKVLREDFSTIDDNESQTTSRSDELE